MSARLQSNDAAGEFDSTDPSVARVIDILAKRCEQADGLRGEQTTEHLHRLVEEWSGEVERCRAARRKLVYRAPTNQTNYERLLFAHTDRVRGLWPTLNSMRNVENTGLLKRL